MVEFLLNKNIGVDMIVKLLSCLAPFFISFTIPMGILVGVLIGFGRLAADNEVIAIKTSGISPIQLYIPTFVASVIIALAMIGMNFNIKPGLLNKAAEIVYRIQFKVLTSIEPKKFYSDLTGEDIDIVLYCGDKDKDTNELKNLNIKLSTSLSQIKETAEQKNIIKDSSESPEAQYAKIKNIKKKYEQEQKEVLLLASRGMINTDLKKQEIHLNLSEGSLHLLSRSGDIQNNMVKFRDIDKTIKANIGKIKGGGYLNPIKQMTTAELLKEYDKQLPSRKKYARRIMLEYHQRFSFPMACIAFTLIAMPLGIFIRPSGKSYGFILSFALLFLYYIFQNWGSVMFQQGKPFGTLAVYSPNIIMSIIGLILIFISLRR